MINIEISLYYHLKQKAGVGTIPLHVPEGTSIKEIKLILEDTYPALITHLDNVMILQDKKIVLDEDVLNEDALIAFLTPIGGG
ncbi:MAG: MoaD/ThiS family protein [Pelolinea sp.]|nr:MoaD/ThiS family protein [Pelolinea sp.]